MTLTEVKRDLFTVPDDYYLAHCISADFALGAGIAVEFDKRFNCGMQLREAYPRFMDFYDNYASTHDIKGHCLITGNGRIYNLVTKRNYYNKPTYKSLEQALVAMKNMTGTCKLAMPKIGCGLDRLKWDKVKQMIAEVYKDTNAEIVICSL